MTEVATSSSDCADELYRSLVARFKLRFPPGDLDASDASWSDIKARENRLFQLADAMAKLPKDERMAMEMRYLYEQPKSLAEIATRLGLPTAKAAALLLGRGLKRIRDMLQE